MRSLRAAALTASQTREAEQARAHRAAEANRKRREKEQWDAKVRMAMAGFQHASIWGWEGFPSADSAEVVALHTDEVPKGRTYGDWARMVVHVEGVNVRIKRYQPSGEFTYEIVLSPRTISDEPRADKWRLVRQITCLADIGDYIRACDEENRPATGMTE